MTRLILQQPKVELAALGFLFRRPLDLLVCDEPRLVHVLKSWRIGRLFRASRELALDQQNPCQELRSDFKSVTYTNRFEVNARCCWNPSGVRREEDTHHLLGTREI